MLRVELDTGFTLVAMPAELVKGLAEPVVTYAVRDHSPDCESATG